MTLNRMRSVASQARNFRSLRAAGPSARPRSRRCRRTTRRGQRRLRGVGRGRCSSGGGRRASRSRTQPPGTPTSAAQASPSTLTRRSTPTKRWARRRRGTAPAAPRRRRRRLALRSQALAVGCAPTPDAERTLQLRPRAQPRQPLARRALGTLCPRRELICPPRTARRKLPTRNGRQRSAWQRFLALSHLR